MVPDIDHDRAALGIPDIDAENVQGGRTAHDRRLHHRTDDGLGTSGRNGIRKRLKRRRHCR